ncbi:MAG: hypothetical protein IJZ56_04105 [Oscillospiraceae bacterium]|nr:hypothetical protein [Oscillospiraceae bacterium]
MKNKIHLYVSRKNVATWLMALCLVGSAVARVITFSGLEGAGLWSQIILPVTAVLLFVAISLLAGKEMFYKTALPVWLLGICYSIQLYGKADGHLLIWGMYCTCILFYCLLYTWITCGFIRFPWLLLPLHLVGLSVALYCMRQYGMLVLADVLLFAGLSLLSFAIKVHTDGAYHPTWGDRIDGRRIRSTPAMDQISPYLMVHRNESSNMFEESVEISNLEQYVRRKRREGLTTFGMSHVIIAAYVRTVAKYPGLNRFLAGQKVYTHGEDITLCMTVKKEMSASSPDTVIKAHFTPYDTAEDVYRKFNEQVELAKTTPLESGTDNTAGLMALIPGLALKFVVWLLKVLDYFGLIPKFLLEVSPFHGSAYFTSMGSLGIRPIYHHLFNFGTIPVFVAFGRKRRAEEIHNGEIVDRKYVDLKFTVDERICDGYYYASLIKHFVRILHNPEILDQPPEEVVKDID